MVLAGKKSCKFHSILEQKSTKNDHSASKWCAWRSNQEWRSICADTISNLRPTIKTSDVLNNLGSTALSSGILQMQFCPVH